MANFPIEIMVKLTYNYTEVIIVAEFCLDCWNEINGTDETKDKYVYSKELDLCEGCGEWKHVIVRERGLFDVFRYDILGFFKNEKESHQ